MITEPQKYFSTSSINSLNTPTGVVFIIFYLQDNVLKKGRVALNKFEREIVRRNFAPILKARRDQLGYTQEKLAAESGVAKNTIGRLETKRSYPEITTIIKLCTGLKITPGQLHDELAYRITPELDELDKKKDK